MIRESKVAFVTLVGELRWVNETRTEVIYKLTAAARVVMLEVIPEQGVPQISPEILSGSPLSEAGLHSIPVGGAIASEASPAAQQSSRSAQAQRSRLRVQEEYERCMDNARQTAPRITSEAGGSRTKTDSTGRVIVVNGPTSLAANSGFDNYDLSKGEARCRGERESAAAREAATSSYGPTRYLVFFASEIPVRAVDLTSLVINEGDINSIVLAVGRKLYNKAPWSGYHLRW